MAGIPKRTSTRKTEQKVTVILYENSVGYQKERTECAQQNCPLSCTVPLCPKSRRGRLHKCLVVPSKRGRRPRLLVCEREREEKGKRGRLCSAEGKSKLYYKTMAGKFLILFNLFCYCFEPRNFVDFDSDIPLC